MKEQLQQRLQTLKAEYETGEKMLADLEAKQIDLQKTLLRISGAIQVLEEMLDEANSVAETGAIATSASASPSFDTHAESLELDAAS